MSEHKLEDLKGRVIEAAGDLIGDKELKREGQLDQASAAAKRVIDAAAEKIDDALEPKKP